MSDILMTIVIATATVAVNAIVAVRVKFAADAAQALSSLKKLALQTGQWLLNGYLVVHLFFAVFSSEPLSRMAVFDIALTTTVLLFILMGHLLERVIRMVGSVADVITLAVGTMERHVEITHDVVHGLQKIHGARLTAVDSESTKGPE